MRRRTPVVLLSASALVLTGALAATASPGARGDDGPDGHGRAQEPARFATFNASLNRNAAGQLVTDLSTGDNQQAKNVEIGRAHV